MALATPSPAQSRPGAGPADPGDTISGYIAALSKVSRSYFPAVAPDGRAVAFISTTSGSPQLWSVPIEGGRPIQLTALNDPVTSVYWSDDGQWLAFGVAPGGGLNEQVYLVRPDGTALHRLTRNDREGNWLQGWHPDSQHLLLASDRRGGGSMDIHLLDIGTGEARLIRPSPGTDQICCVARDGRRALIRRTNTRGDADLYLVDLITRQERLLTPHTPPRDFSGQLAPDGRTVFLESNRDTDMSAFGRIRVADDGGPQPLELIKARTDAELQATIINPQGTQVALVWNVAGETELGLYSPASHAIEPIPSLPVEIADADEMVYSPDGQFLVLTMYGAQSPPNVWVLNVQTRQFRQLTFSEAPAVSLDKLVRPRLVRYSSFDGLSLSGWLYLPAGATAQVPMVLSFHGGPETQELPTFHPDYQALLANGIGVFAPNVRGSAGFGSKFVNLDNGALRVNAIRDIKASVDYLVSTGIADPQRIGIMGGSYGGFMAVAGLTEFPELFAAGADLYGIVNFTTFFQHTEPWMAATSKVEYGDPERDSVLLRELSPIHKITRVRAPLLVLHGANDTNVPVAEAEQVVGALRERGVPVEFTLFPGEGHGWSSSATRVRSNTLVTQWFIRWLRPGAGGESPPSPVSKPPGGASSDRRLATIAAAGASWREPSPGTGE